MSNEGKNMTLNDFKEVVKKLFLHNWIIGCVKKALCLST